MNIFKLDISPKFITYFIFIVVLFIPSLFWGDAKFIGGDDTMLYYFYPTEYISYLFNIISDNNAGILGSYFSQAQLIPTIFTLSILKSLFFTQNMILGLNLALGYLFLYKILCLLSNKKKIYLSSFTALLYPFSIFIYFTSYNNFFPAIFLVSIIPIFIYYFIHGLTYNNNSTIIISSIIFSLFLTPVLHIAWIGAFFICSIPILIYYLIRYKIKFFNKIAIFVFLSTLLSLFFVIPISDSIINRSQYDLNTINRVLSNDDTISRNFNTNLIKSVSLNNKVLYPMTGLFHKSLQEEFSWYSLDLFNRYYIKILPINILFLVVIIVSSILLLGNKNINQLYSYLIFSLLLSIYFFTVNIGEQGLSFFLFLNNNIPGFAMFRNMYDKFAFPMAFYYTLTFSIGANVLYEKIKNNLYKKILFILILTLVFINIKPFALGDLYKSRVFRTTQNISDRINDFNPDFKNMISFIREMDVNSGRFLWLPMSESNYIPILGQDKYNYYLGQSPLLVLTGKNDFSSDMSFLLTSSNSIVNKISEGKFEEVSEFLQKRNVEYIILNKDLSKEIKDSYLYSNIDNENFYNIEDSDFFKFIKGEKIKDFGNKYSIYKISNQFENKKIYLRDEEQIIFNKSLQDKIKFSKLASYRYSISLKNYNGEYIVFLDPYHQYWNLYLKNKQIEENQKIIYDYANQWTIDPEYIKANFDKSYYKENPDGSIDLELTLFFQPQAYFYVGIMISGTTLMLCLGYLGYHWYAQRKNSKGLSARKKARLRNIVLVKR